MSQNRMTDIRELLNIYSRRSDHYLQSSNYEIHDPLKGERFLGCSNNNFCDDHLNVYLSIDNNKVKIQHYGDYCALAHASAELFCELIYNQDTKTLALMLKYIQAIILKENVTFPKEFEDTKFMYIRDLLMLSMSPNRKKCIILAWEATMNAWSI